MVLGSKELVEEILKRVEGSKGLKEIPKTQRHIDWRLPEELFTGEVLKGRDKFATATEPNSPHN